MLKNCVLELNKDEGRELASNYFTKMCGYDRNHKLKSKKVEESIRTLDDIYDQIHIRAVITEYGKECIHENTMILDQIKFSCSALSTIDIQYVDRIYLYLLTIGEIREENENILNKVYYDMWETAFVDVGRDLLKRYIEIIQQEQVFHVSESLGPGFFGMPVTDVGKILRILDYEKIDMKLLDSGFMLPVKSCTGFFLVTSKEEKV